MILLNAHKNIIYIIYIIIFRISLYLYIFFQGFCCHCTLAEKNANTMNEAKNYKRSGISCKFATSNSQASAHCMRMDDLW